MKKIFVVLLCGLFVVGCSSVANLQTDDAPMTITKTVAKDVKVYSTNKIGSEYTIIGEVVADVDAGEEAGKAVSKLRTQAAELGADAVINLRLEIDTGYFQSAIKAYGTAVKTK